MFLASTQQETGHAFACMHSTCVGVHPLVVPSTGASEPFTHLASGCVTSFLLKDHKIRSNKVWSTRSRPLHNQM